MTALQWVNACAHGDMRFLRAHPQFIGFQDEHLETGLMAAARRNQATVCKWLLSGEVMLLNEHRQTALMLAA